MSPGEHEPAPRAGGVSVSRDALHDEAERALRHFLAPVFAHFDDPTVNEIMINPDAVFMERHGEIDRLSIELAPKNVDAAIRSIMTLNGKDPEWIMDARLPGIRVAAAVPPVSMHGPMMCIRKHARSRLSLHDYVVAGGLDVLPEAKALASRDASAGSGASVESGASLGGEGLKRFLEWAMRSRKTLMIVGGTSSGKTTLLSAMLQCIPDDQRIVTVEDTHELILAQPNVVQLEARNEHGVTVRTLIRLCLRLRPDRIIVGEIRGAEAYDLLDAMNTGHPGTLFTIHGDSPARGLERLESILRMAPAAATLPPTPLRALIASAIDYVIFQSRVGGARGPERVLALDKALDDRGGYRARMIFDRLAVLGRERLTGEHIPSASFGLT